MKKFEPFQSAKRPTALARGLTYKTVSISLAVVILLLPLALNVAGPALSQETPNVLGMWKFGESTVLIQSDPTNQNEIQGVFLIPAGSDKERGYKRGDVLIKEGTLQGNLLRGKLSRRLELVYKEKCHKIWEQWFDIELKLSTDGSELRSQFLNSNVDTGTCTINRRYWSQFSLTRTCDATPADQASQGLEEKPTLVLVPTNSPQAELSLNSVTKGQPFFAFVRMSKRRAAALGSTIALTLSSGSRKVNVPLVSGSADSVTVTYGPKDPVVIADNGMGVEHIGLRVQNGQTVKALYSDASVEFTVYNSWVQQGIAHHEKGFLFLLTVYEELLRETEGRADREVLNQKMLAIKNARHLILDYEPGPSENFTDYTRYYLGENYHWLLSSWGSGAPATGGEYSEVNIAPDKLWSSGRGKHDRRFNIVLTSSMEDALISLSRKQGETAYRDIFNEYIPTAMAMLMYTVVVNVTEADRYFIVLEGIDAMGQPVDKRARVLAGLSLVRGMLIVGRTTARRLRQLQNIRGLRTGGRLGVLAPRPGFTAPGGAAAPWENIAVGPRVKVGPATVPGAIEVTSHGHGTPLQRYGHTCGESVRQGMRRDAGLPYQNELPSACDLYKQGLISPKGMKNWQMVGALQLDGARAKFVGVDLRPGQRVAQMTKDLIEGRKVGTIMNVGTEAKPAYHWVRVEEIGCSKTGSYVTFGDPWNGKSWRIPSREFARRLPTGFVVAEWPK